MLSIGFTEIAVIVAVALIVVGPERLPREIRRLGRMYGQMRRAADELRRAFVLEADRQDAEERMERLRERRRQIAERDANRRPPMAAEGVVAHKPMAAVPPPDDEGPEIPLHDPEEPAPRAHELPPEPATPEAQP